MDGVCKGERTTILALKVEIKVVETKVSARLALISADCPATSQA